MSSIRDLGEFGLIDMLTQGLPLDDSVALGIGDDCAIVKVGKEQLLFSTDAFVEDVHFGRQWASPEDIGYKAAAAALSDIAAMGGNPTYMLITLACPRDTDAAFLERVYQGLRNMADIERVNIIGGDTSVSRQGLVLNIMVVGKAINTPLRRSGARPGDIVCVTGHPGSSALGLHALEREDRDAPPSLIKAHLRPRPKILEGMYLSSGPEVTAMIDVSDGLAQDLGHIAAQSGVVIDIRTNKLPLSHDQINYARKSGLSPVDTALTGGEDYELALTIAPSTAILLLAEFKLQFVLPLTVIGTVREGAPGVFVDGKPYTQTGYCHF